MEKSDDSTEEFVKTDGNGVTPSKPIDEYDFYKYENPITEKEIDTLSQLKTYINDTFDELAEMLNKAEEKNEISSEDVKKIKSEMFGYVDKDEKKENLRDFRVTLNVTQNLGNKLKEESYKYDIPIGVLVRDIIVDYFLEKRKRDFDGMLNYYLREWKEELD